MSREVGYELIPATPSVRCAECERLIQCNMDYYRRLSDGAPVCIKCVPTEVLKHTRDAREPQ